KDRIGTLRQVEQVSCVGFDLWTLKLRMQDVKFIHWQVVAPKRIDVGVETVATTVNMLRPRHESDATATLCDQVFRSFTCDFIIIGHALGSWYITADAIKGDKRYSFFEEKIKMVRAISRGGNRCDQSIDVIGHQ